MRSILFCTTYYTEVEAKFWAAVSDALKEHGFDLYVSATTGMNGAMPTIRQPYGLDTQSELEYGRSGTFELDEDALLERERLWSQDAEDTEARKASIARCATSYGALLSAFRPQLCVIWNGEHTRDLILRELLKQCACPMVFAERSPFPGMIYMDKEGIVSKASFVRDGTIQWSDEEERNSWSNLSSQYEQQTVASASTWWEQPTASSPTETRQRLDIPPDKKIVLFAGQVDQDTQNFLFSPHFANNVEAFERFCSLVKPHDDVFVLGKHHPKSQTSVEQYRQALSCPGVWTTDVSLQECLEIADAVAAVNSTVLFEAMMRGKPCLSLGQTILTGRDIFYEIQSPDDVATVKAWLSGAGHQERQNAWSRRMAWMFARHLYALDEKVALDGVCGPRELATRLASLASETQPDYSPLVATSLDLLKDFNSELRELRTLRRKLTQTENRRKRTQKELDKYENHPVIKRALRVRGFLHRVFKREQQQGESSDEA